MQYFANVVEILYEYCGGKLFAGTHDFNLYYGHFKSMTNVIIKIINYQFFVSFSPVFTSVLPKFHHCFASV